MADPPTDHRSHSTAESPHYSTITVQAASGAVQAKEPRAPSFEPMPSPPSSWHSAWPQMLLLTVALTSGAHSSDDGHGGAARLCRDGTCASLHDIAHVRKVAFAAASPVASRSSYSSCCHSCDRVSSCSGSGGDEHHIVNLFLPHVAAPPGNRARRFLEIGGFDGLRETNTLFVEHCLGWDGLLIEAQPTAFAQLKENRPGVLTLHAAACTGNATHVTFVDSGDTNGKIFISKAACANTPCEKTSRVPCVKLGTALPKLGFERIDYFSLDTQGAELLVAQSVDWNAVQAAVIVVEEIRVTVAKNRQVAALLHDIGMVRAVTLCWRSGAICDGYFVNPKLVDMAGLSVAIGATNFGAEQAKGLGRGCHAEKSTDKGGDAWLLANHGNGRGKQRQYLNMSVDCKTHDEGRKYPYKGHCALCGDVGKAWRASKPGALQHLTEDNWKNC